MPASMGRVGYSSLFPSAPQALPALLPASVSPLVPTSSLLVLGCILWAPTSQLLGGHHSLKTGKGKLWFGAICSE